MGNGLNKGPTFRIITYHISISRMVVLMRAEVQGGELINAVWLTFQVFFQQTVVRSPGT